MGGSSPCPGHHKGEGGGRQWRGLSRDTAEPKLTPSPSLHSSHCNSFLAAVDEEEEYECVSVLNSHTQDVKHVVWHPNQEVRTDPGWGDPSFHPRPYPSAGNGPEKRQPSPVPAPPTSNHG